MLVSTDTMLGLGGKMFHNVLSLFIFCKQRFKFYQNFLVFNIPCQGWGGGGCFLSSFHFMYQDYSKIFCIPMLHAAHGRLVVKLLHSDWCRKYFRDQRFLGVIVRPTVTRLYRFYPISSRYVSVVIIRKHWKQEHWRYIVGDFLGFSNFRGFF